MQQMAIDVFQLDRALERFGPEAKDARDLLHLIVRTEVERASAPGESRPPIDSPMEAQRAAAALFEQVADCRRRRTPRRFVQSSAAALSGARAPRLLVNEQARGAISWPFLIVLVFWLAIRN